MSVSPKGSKDPISLNNSQQKETSSYHQTDHQQFNTETVSFDGGVIVTGSDDEDDEVYDDELDENEVLVDDDDDDEDEIYNDLYNGSTGGSCEMGVVGSDEMMDDNSSGLKMNAGGDQTSDLVIMNGDEFYASCNGGPVDEEIDEDATSHSTEITLLGGVSSSQNSFEKPPGASPSLLKKFSKISKLPKKISVNAVASTEKKLSKLAVNKSLVLGQADLSGNNKYFKKFKFKRSGNKNEERKVMETKVLCLYISDFF